MPTRAFSKTDYTLLVAILTTSVRNLKGLESE
jgi:hypothetical protein